MLDMIKITLEKHRLTLDQIKINSSIKKKKFKSKLFECPEPGIGRPKWN